MNPIENHVVASGSLQITLQLPKQDNQSENLCYPKRALVLKTSSNCSNYLDAISNMDNKNDSTNCSLNSFNSVFLPQQDRHIQNGSSISQQKMLKDRFEQMVKINSIYASPLSGRANELQLNNPYETSKQEEQKESFFLESASKKQGNIHEEQYLSTSLNKVKRKQIKVIDQRHMEEKRDTQKLISSAIQGKKNLNQSQTQNPCELHFHLKDQDNSLKPSSSPYKDLLQDRSILEQIIASQFTHTNSYQNTYQINLPSVSHPKNNLSDNPVPKLINNKTLRNARRRQLLALQRFRSLDENNNKIDNNNVIECQYPDQEQRQQQQQIQMKKCVISFDNQNNKILGCSSQESPKQQSSEVEVSFKKRRPIQLPQQETLIIQENMTSRNQSPLQANLVIRKLQNQKNQFKKNYFTQLSPSPAVLPPNQQDNLLQLSSQQLSSDFSSSQPSQIVKINHSFNLHALSKTSSISFNDSTKTTTISPRIHNKPAEVKDTFRSSCSANKTAGFIQPDNPPPFKFHMNNSLISNNSNNVRRLSAQSLRGSPRNANQNNSKQLKLKTHRELVLSFDSLEIDQKQQSCLIEGKSYQSSSNRKNGDRLENPFLNILKETLKLQVSTVHNLKNKRTSPRNNSIEWQDETSGNTNSNNNCNTSRVPSRVTSRNTTATILRETVGTLKQLPTKKSENTKNMFVTGERFKEKNSTCVSPNRTVQTARSPVHLRRILLSVDKPKSKIFEEINEFKQSNEGFADHQIQQADQIWNNFSIEEYIHLSKTDNHLTNNRDDY